MKKFLSVLLTLVSVICISFAFGGCGSNVEVRGKFYSLEKAYDNGWLSMGDLESIAYYYNDYSNRTDGPDKKLSSEEEEEIKRAFLNQIAEDPFGEKDEVKINFYYGTFNGNIVVAVRYSLMCIDPVTKDEVYIGGVLFKNYWDAQTWVYHLN